MVAQDMRLFTKIFRRVSVFTVSIILVLVVVLSAIYYHSYEQDAEHELIAQAQDAALVLNRHSVQESIEVLQEQFSGEVRYTLIASDGTVLYDSYEASEVLENHAGRPEVKEALEAGQASSLRYSDTLQTDTLYAAVKLQNDTLVRLAETRHSLLAFLSGVIGPVLVAMLVTVVLTFLLSRMLTRRIMKPIDALDFSQPLQNDIYEEMEPLLRRIDEQQNLLKQQNKELAEAEALRRDFSSNVSHEMKTPLQVISGYAELMQNDMVGLDKRQEVATLIYDEAQAMRKLIDDILTLSRLDESAEGVGVEYVELYALSCTAAARLESFADAHGVTVQVQGEPASIRGNQTLAAEMIYNLIENGIRYNQAGGKALVNVEQVESNVVLRVTDTGPGIPVDMQEKIFERFFRIDKSRSKETGGTGLGLAIVKHAVLYHQGTIEIISSPGAGTTFVLSFPCA